MATKKFKCKRCGYVHEGDKAPEKCPVCQAPSSEFEEIVEGQNTKKKGMNTNSNTYTILYAVIMVVIVAFLLAFVNSSLRNIQDENVRKDTKKQILSALRVEISDAAKDYETYVQKDILVDASTGQELETVNDSDFSTNYDNEAKANRFHVFVCNVNGETKYVIPVNGAGLWGAIWGYIALNADKQTVYGTYFSHASETPGLGAEIATEKFQNEFIDKNVLNGEDIALSVVKFGTVSDPSCQVDGISGGTITSNGVNSMIKACLKNYTKFLTIKE